MSSKPPKGKKSLKAKFNRIKSGSSSSADPKAMERLEKAKKRIANKEKKNKYKGMSGKELEDAEFNRKTELNSKKMQKARKERSDTLKELRGG